MTKAEVHSIKVKWRFANSIRFEGMVCMTALSEQNEMRNDISALGCKPFGLGEYLSYDTCHKEPTAANRFAVGINITNN